MPGTDIKNIKKKNLNKNVTKLYQTLLAIYFNEYNNIIDEKNNR